MYHGESLIGWVFLGAVKRSQTVEDKIEADSLKVELQSAKELIANLKKKLEEKEKSNSVSKVVIHDDDDRVPDLSGIKKEPGFEIARNILPMHHG